jgi:type VI secretion system secreted protein VgrG
MPVSDSERSEKSRIFEWSSQRRFSTGKVTFNDYDFKQSTADLKSEDTTSESYAQSKMELYDYPGKYEKRSDGDKYTKVALQAQQALDHRRYGGGDAVNLFPGGQVSLEKHPEGSENKQYLIVQAQHSFATEGYSSAAGNSSERHYFGHYVFLEVEQPFRMPIVTPKPLIHGIQTAVVVGNAGEEIDVDKYGRIWVQFHWDRVGKKDRNSSLPIRVAQVWAGKQWGGQFIPRLGMEVVVEFLEGDPDRPLIVGAVYNDVYKHPYDLPANKTQSGVKSDSSKGHHGYNEIMFEDKKGGEKIGVHAQKNLGVVVNNNETRVVGYNMDTEIHNAETRTIGKDFKVPTGQASHEVTIKMGDDKLKLETGSRDVDIALMDHLKAGILIELKCGGSKITMTPASISIESPLITLNGALIKLN